MAGQRAVFTLTVQGKTREINAFRIFKKNFLKNGKQLKKRYLARVLFVKACRRLVGATILSFLFRRQCGLSGILPRQNILQVAGGLVHDQFQNRRHFAHDVFGAFFVNAFAVIEAARI